jgi:hypothetical protein
MTKIKKFIEIVESSDFKVKENSRISEMIEFYKKGIPFDKWKEFANKKRKKLENSSGIMLGILEDQWSQISYPDIKREEFYSLRDSPLEILHFCIADDFLTYPPPEILWVIAKQFQWYMENEGEVTLEEAFFGKSIKSKGHYSKRTADTKHKLYKRFDLFVKAEPNMPQSKLLEKICKTPPHESPSYTESIFATYKENEFDHDSFLKGYRRWKKKNKDK